MHLSKQLVLMDHDGGVDDYLATMLLMTMEDIQPIGIVVTPADCYIQPAVSATRKILDLVGRSDIPVAQSTVRGINPFPTLYRRDSFAVDHLPILNEPRWKRGAEKFRQWTKWIGKNTIPISCTNELVEQLPIVRNYL